MTRRSVTHVQKACAYLTRDGRELLVFDGPEHAGLQIPKGTVEPDESPREAFHREVREESGLEALEAPHHLVTDVWTRRRHPPKRYVRHFFHATVDEPRDRWVHTVTGAGPECGSRFEFSWLSLESVADREFALDLDDHAHLLERSSTGGPSLEESSTTTVDARSSTI